MARLNAFTIELSEAEFQSQVCRLAENLGWNWMHVVTTGTGRHFPIRGPLGSGWPDLVLLRNDRLLFVELKKEKGPIRLGQDLVLSLLQRAAETYIWKPSDWEQIQDVLT